MWNNFFVLFIISVRVNSMCFYANVYFMFFDSESETAHGMKSTKMKLTQDLPV